MTERDPWNDRTPLWREEVISGHQLLAHDVEVDVVVVGAGIAGLTAADELSRAGRQVAVLESRSVGSGATGSTTAKVTSLHGAIYRTLVARHGGRVRRRQRGGASVDRGSSR